MSILSYRLGSITTSAQARSLYQQLHREEYVMLVSAHNMALKVWLKFKVSPFLQIMTFNPDKYDHI
jgi:hypothetical protein